MTAEEENYEQAIKAVNLTFGGGRVSDSLQAVLNDECSINLNKKSGIFWISATAFKDFIQLSNNGYLLVPEVLPDMTADPQQAIHDADIIIDDVRKF